MIYKLIDMKRFTFLIVMGFTWLCCMAQNPSLPLFQAFDGRYNNEEGVKITEIIQPSSNNYYYSIAVKDNSQIINQLIDWFEETEKYANSINKTINSGKYNIILFIPESDINIGIEYPADKNKVSIYMQSNKPFLK